MKRFTAWMVLAAGALAPAVGVSAQVRSGSVEVRLIEAPSDRRDDPRARIYIVDHLHPGDSISRKIGVNNTSDDALEVDLYAGAARLEDGEFVPSPRRETNELATWTTVSPEKVDVVPGDESVATVTIAVPDDASPGERYGVVWAQLPKSIPKDGGPSEVNRVGIRIYLSVGPGGEPASDFVIDSLVAQRVEDGTPVVVARVRNTGGRALDMSGSLRLAGGPGGLSAGPFPAKLGTTLGIGAAEPVTVALSKELPDGPWDAKIDLRSGLVERSASAAIRFPHSEGVAKPVKVDAPSSGWPWIALFVLGALAMLVVILLLRRRRRREGDA
jgi:hypothetical protein